MPESLKYLWRITAAVALGLQLMLGAALAPPPLAAGERFFVLAATTSSDDSGLLAHLIPIFSAETGIGVRTLVRGTGQALRVAKAGDADVLMVHHRASEEAFVKDGYGVRRFDVMYNDFLLVGPQDDPAGLAGESDVTAALGKIAAAAVPFASRGDQSGTHRKERALWAAAAIDPGTASGQWYRETGAGMGATLNTAAALGAYSLVDRGTWTSFQNKRGLEVLLAGDPRLHNPYGIILVNPERHPHVKAAEGEAFIDWILSPAGQAAIAAFRINDVQLFFPYYETGKDAS